MRGEIPMFDKNIKLKVTYEEYVLIRDLLMEYRNSLVRKGEKLWYKKICLRNML